MKFKVNIPFIEFNIYGATKKQTNFFSELFFSTNVVTKKLFSVNLKIVKKIKVDKKYFVENDVIADSNNFVILDTKNNKCKVNFHDFTNKSINIEIENNFDLYYLFTFIIEPLMIIWGAKHNLLFLHASGLAKKGKVTIFPAWRNTGKTNTILESCKKGYQFNGDDFCLLHNKEVYLYPKALNLFSYNLRAFPHVFNYLGKSTEYRLKMTTFVKKMLFNLSQIFSGPISKVLFRISQLAEVSTNIKLFPEQLGIEVCEKGNLTNVFLLQKANLVKPKIEKINLIIAQEKISSIILYELKDFFEVYSKYLFLFSKKHEIISGFESNYSRLLKKNITSIKYKLQPRGTQ